VKETRRRLATIKNKHKYEKERALNARALSPPPPPEGKKKRQRRQPRQNTESEDQYEYESSNDDKGEDRRPAKSENAATKAETRTSSKSAQKICRIQKKCGIYLQASTPKCPLYHEMHVTRILRLDQFVQPTCNDCEVPLSPNDLCSVCWRCEPLHLLCVQCSFASSTERVVIN
jgi:hypothetical protein